jgi:hypothetical protein
LWIGENEELRHLLHDLTSTDPVLGYGAELLWRDFFRVLGRRFRGDDPALTEQTHRIKNDGSVTAKTDGTIIDEFRERAESVQTRLAELGAVHCIFLIRGGEIWRWTASSAGIRREVLNESADVTRNLVAETWQMMSTEPAGEEEATPPLLQENLQKLARLLLPAEVTQKTGVWKNAPFFITTDGFLGRIPFETFDVEPEGAYTPLLRLRDVAYLRYAGEPTGVPGTDPGVILINAKPSSELQKRYPFQRILREVEPEGRTVAALNPDARFLAGEAATKSNLNSVWEDASFIYLAAHTLRDPQVPYLMLIPLATTGVTPVPETAYLDITDIRTADLSDCSLVVLSGCSSGEPYVEIRNTGPSLGDAFLDAGAGAVVQTFWDVRDDEARRLMTSYVQSWGSPGLHKIRALCESRRRMIPSQADSSLSFGWASYSIKTGEL